MLKQKFRHGNLVHIIDGSCQFQFKQGCDAIILGSYNDFHGTEDIFKYKVMFDDGSTSAWYEDHQLTLVDKGGEYLIENTQEKKLIREAKDILLHRNLNHMYESDIVTLLRFIGFDYSIGNNYFGFWERVLPVFLDIKKAESPDLLKQQYPNYDIEGVWNAFHVREEKND